MNPQVDTATFEQMRDLYHQGQYLQAYEMSKQFGPLREWTDPQMRVLGGRMAHNLGAERLGRVLHRLAYQENPEIPEVRYFYTLSMSSRWGPLETWRRIERGGDLEGPSEITADWRALKAMTLALLRDFESAEKNLQAALDLHPDRSWLHVCRTFLLERQDRPDDALATAAHALELRPWYRPAVQNLAHRLVQVHRDEDAQALMREGVERLESGDLRIQLAALLLETQQYEEARELYESLPKYMPLADLERKRPEWLAARRADAAYYCNDYEQAIEQARSTDSKFYKALADRLEENKPDAKRVVLPVKFVRQNHLTCAPATLSALSGYWERPVEHLELAEEICFDGTPAHCERRWADSNGFVTREFRVTIEVASQLIDRGVPFTLTTVDPGNAHLQAVIGYDDYRHTLVIRDPGERHYDEFPLTEMLEHYAACGPRGMVMAPADQEHLLEGIEFPEAEFYDLLFECELALEEHDRERAQAALAKMETLDENHRLTLRARGNIAHYDGNTSDLLAVVESLLEKFPDDVNTIMSKLACLQELGRREDRVELLETQIAKPDCDPIFWSRYASELVDDAREHDKATYYLRRAAKYRPHDVAAYDLLGSVLMEQQQYDEAITLYRFAACLSELNERQAQTYFFAARVQDQTKAAMRLIKDRFERFGKKSSQPMRTLCWAYDQLERTTDAFKVLEIALKHHPEDAELLLYAALFCGRFGKLKQAHKLLEKAKGKSHQNAWRRSAASLAYFDGDLETALQHWLEVLKSDPLDLTAHRFAADLLGDTQGPQAALEHLRKYVDRFPHSYALNMLLIETLRDEDPDEMQTVLERFIEMNPTDAWALRELAFHMIRQNEYDGVATVINRAHEIEPTHPAVGYVRGSLARHRQNLEQAREHFRESLREAVDYEYSVSALLECCESRVEREEALEFVYGELQSQVTFGDGLLAYQMLAAQTLEPDVLLERLREARKKRPDLWHSWSAEIRQLSNMQRHEEAVALADKASDRFPLLPRIWIDRAMACAACGNIDGEIESLQQAKEINPSWGEPARLLSEAYEKKGDLQSAREEIERVIGSEPRDVRNHGFLASLMWDMGERDEAVETIVKALQMQPGYSWGWGVLREWAAILDRNEMVINLTRELTEKRPRDYRAWLLYAESLGEREQVDQAVEALNRAIQINPSNLDAYNQKAAQLAHAGRFDEALQATRPVAFSGQVPLELQARAAWIEGERGNIETAVSMMEQVLRQDRDYFWAWHRLAEWYNFVENDDKYHAAAKEMIRLEPQNWVAWGYMGDAELRRDNKAEAKRYFLQAVQLSPSYGFATSRLMDLQLEDKEYDAAIETLQLASPHLSEDWRLSEEIRIESLRGDQDAAFRLMRRLAVTPAEDSQAIDAAVESLWRADWAEQALPLIDELLNLPDAQPGVAFVYVHLSTTMDRYETCERRLKTIQDRPEVYKEGVRKFIEEMGESEHEAPRLHAFIAQHRQWLHADLELWETVGDAFNACGQYDKALEWMGSWQSRQGVQASHALTVAFAYWEQLKPHEAIEATRFVLNNLPPDQSAPAHLTFAAFYELAYGSPETCLDAVSMIDPGRLSGLYNLLYQYVVTVLENLSTGRPYGELQAQLTAIYESLPEGVREAPFLKWQYKVMSWRAADLHGKWLKAMWLKWRI